MGPIGTQSQLSLNMEEGGRGTNVRVMPRETHLTSIVGLENGGTLGQASGSWSRQENGFSPGDSRKERHLPAPGF